MGVHSTPPKSSHIIYEGVHSTPKFRWYNAHAPHGLTAILVVLCTPFYSAGLL